MTAPTHVATADAMSDALERLSDHAFTDDPGLATHGPMGAEALATSGFVDEVPHWVEQYKARHAALPAPPAVERLDPAERASWTAALGDERRLTDWSEMFGRQLREQPWQDTLATWVPVLISGYGGAMTHGLIRTAHAVRSLATTPTPSDVLIDELAAGLAYWAGSYKELPGRPTLGGDLSLPDAIAALPRPTEAWNPMEAGRFARLPELPEFAGAVEALAAPTTIDTALSDLSEAFAQMLVTSPQAVPIGLVHALTPIAGARRLVPYVPSLTTERLYAQLWHVNAAIAVGFVHRPNTSTAGPGSEVQPPQPDELASRAAEHGDPHVIKYTEAAVAEHRLRPAPSYLQAAAQLIAATPAW